MVENFEQYHGTDDYIVSSELQNIVNVSIALERPLLVRGEPGTGKTLLAHSIAKGLGKRLIIWNIKSTTKAKDGLYVYDTVQRLYDSRFGDKEVSDIKQYIRLGKLGEAFTSEEQVVLLIDEIDKADIEFPNDLLNELDVMSFFIYETGETISATHRPIVIITSNAEKELPDAFLRRCIFHYIEFPDPQLMERIVYVHHPNVRKELIWQCLEKFYKLRKVEYLRKKPSTSELIDWIGVLIKAGITEKELTDGIPFLGTLIKKEQDYDMLSKEKGYGDERSYY
ncbi:MAG: AAA family ATPase [Candidatus Helarchaeota archaeon]